MDQISVTKLIADRTDELLRTAEGVRRERALRSAALARSAAAEARPVESRPVESRRPTPARDCAPAEPAA